MSQFSFHPRQLRFSFKLVSVSLVFQDDENPGRFMKILSSKMASDQESFTASPERRNGCHIYYVAVNGVKCRHGGGVIAHRRDRCAPARSGAAYTRQHKEYGLAPMVGTRSRAIRRGTSINANK